MTSVYDMRGAWPTPSTEGQPLGLIAGTQYLIIPPSIDVSAGLVDGCSSERGATTDCAMSPGLIFTFRHARLDRASISRI